MEPIQEYLIASSALLVVIALIDYGNTQSDCNDTDCIERLRNMLAGFVTLQFGMLAGTLL